MVSADVTKENLDAASVAGGLGHTAQPAAAVSASAAAAGRPLLTCRGVSKQYGSTKAIDNVDFEAYPGEVHALLGENGAGKSTFIKVLAGAVAPDRGEVFIDGEKVDIRDAAAARALGIGVAFQEISLAPDLSVSENLWLHDHTVTRGGGLSRAKMRSRTLELYDRFEADRAKRIDPDRKVRTLSLAERGLIEVLRAVSREPQILVLDEATASMPARETEWLLKLATSYAALGRVVIFISHRLGEVRAIADRITIFRNGVHALTAPSGELTPDQIIEEMLGRPPGRLYPAPLTPPSQDVVMELRDFSVAPHARDISVELHAGEILGLGGLEGNGQSEFLKGLFGVLPNSGDVIVDGKKVSVRSPEAALKARLGLALIPEDRKHEGVLLGRSIKENVSLAVIPRISRFGLIDHAAERELVDQAMQRFSIAARNMDQAVGTLSGGNQQKVVIAKLLAAEAKILLFHDLTRGVDIGTKADIFALARELTSQGYAILMYSSDNEELVNMCDRIMVLREGELAAILEGEDLSETAIMRAALNVQDEQAIYNVDGPDKKGMQA